MIIFHFSQFEHELFCWYFKHLHAFLAQCGYCVGKWEISGIVNESVNSKIRTILEYWGLQGQSIDEVWCLLEWIAWDSFELEKASCIFGYSFSNPCAFYARSYYVPFWCDMCSSSGHNFISCTFYACYTQPNSFLSLAQCTEFEVGEPFRLVAKFDVDVAYWMSDDTNDVVHNLVEPPLEVSCDVFVQEDSSSLG